MFFILTYLLFWCLLAITGFLISLEIPTYVQDIVKNICAWSPTFVLLILFKKLFPGITLKEFIKMRLGSKAKPLDFILSFILQLLVLAAIIITYLLINNKSLDSLVFINTSVILPVFLINITSGPMGEELGWRGYALGILQKRYNPFWASMILGFIWGFWHLPLWLFSGYSGTDLLIYIIAFLVAILSLSILITYFYNKSKNVFIAIWIHFWFNFLLKILIIDILPLLLYFSVGYLLIAIIIVTMNNKTMMKKPEMSA